MPFHYLDNTPACCDSIDIAHCIILNISLGDQQGTTLNNHFLLICVIKSHSPKAANKGDIIESYWISIKYVSSLEKVLFIEQPSKRSFSAIIFLLPYMYSIKGILINMVWRRQQESFKQKAIRKIIVTWFVHYLQPLISCLWWLYINSWSGCLKAGILLMEN